jgi:hypothetical protein
LERAHVPQVIPPTFHFGRHFVEPGDFGFPHCGLDFARQENEQIDDLDIGLIEALGDVSVKYKKGGRVRRVLKNALETL